MNTNTDTHKYEKINEKNLVQSMIHVFTGYLLIFALNFFNVIPSEPLKWYCVAGIALTLLVSITIQMFFKNESLKLLLFYVFVGLSSFLLVPFLEHISININTIISFNALAVLLSVYIGLFIKDKNINIRKSNLIILSALLVIIVFLIINIFISSSLFTTLLMTAIIAVMCYSIVMEVYAILNGAQKSAAEGAMSIFISSINILTASEELFD